ncbi:hypothetical protein BTA51_14940 [Hahella sp. CCB-MM4]|uniref:AraC family transcriptional regulator n=1 Tax=Hahella sp. (strain CCB-MM4) TaxID=1926491 RepID=UPI000B9AB55B|nr:AraC family transcriptional regulator [Hahella sp. CCB-MM4]OZG72425.1 hypothetical protein BTA51_14940 [Hahella sp. CCB-MM4]
MIPSPGNRQRWHERTTRFIAADRLPALLIDLLNSRGLNQHYYLRKTGIFYEDVLKGNLMINPIQLAQFSRNVSMIGDVPDISFLSGQRLFSGGFGALSTAIRYAPDLRTFISLLIDHSQQFFPLMTIRKLASSKDLYLGFNDVFGFVEGVGKPQWPLKRFLLEQLISFLVSLASWLSGKKQVWELHFDYPEPCCRDAYEVYLSSHLTFDAGYCSIKIPAPDLNSSWPGASETPYRLALKELESAEAAPGLIGMIEGQLRQDLKQLPSLESISDRLSISPATLKRKLKQHDTSYQKLCDLVRKQEAFHLKEVMSFDDEQVANYLNYYDVSNYRRSFRRWLAYS